MLLHTLNVNHMQKVRIQRNNFEMQAHDTQFKKPIVVEKPVMGKRTGIFKAFEEFLDDSNLTYMKHRHESKR